MELLYKPDWEKSRKRLAAVWDRELCDRCCISVPAPRNENDPYRQKTPETAEELEKFYMDETWILERNLERMEKTYFGGDAMPCIFPYFGTGGHAKYFSSKVVYRPNTIWIPPVMEDYESFSFDFCVEKNEAFLRERRIVSFLAREGMGKFLVSPPDNSGSLDALAQLRGDKELLMDLYDQPEEVAKAVAALTAALNETNECFFEDIRENNDGGCINGWLNTWAPGKQMQLQCDTSVMLSPEMFEELVVPELEATAERLTHGLYHMDGIEQLRHLDFILRIPNIRMIQWVQVDGQPPATCFIPELKKIQAHNKALVICVYKNQLKDILSQLSPKGLSLNVLDAHSRKEADEIVRYVENFKYTKEQLI